MFAEYKIEIDKNGLVIKQLINPSGSQPLPKFQANNALQASLQQSLAMKGSGDMKKLPAAAMGANATPFAGGIAAESGFGGGGGFPGQQSAPPVTVIGPNIFMCCGCSDPDKNPKGRK